MRKNVTATLLALACGLSMGVGLAATPYMAVATLAYACMNLGLYHRRAPRLHARFMGAAIALDLGIVLTLEIQRHAINTALSFTLSPLQQAHIAVSSVATVLYFPILFLGWKGLRGALGKNARRWHMRLGISAFAFRTLGFILMFALLGHVQS